MPVVADDGCCSLSNRFQSAWFLIGIRCRIPLGVCFFECRIHLTCKAHRPKVRFDSAVIFGNSLEGSGLARLWGAGLGARWYRERQGQNEMKENPKCLHASVQCLFFTSAFNNISWAYRFTSAALSFSSTLHSDIFRKAFVMIIELLGYDAIDLARCLVKFLLT